MKPGYYKDEDGRPYYWTGINRGYLDENAPEIQGITLKTMEEATRDQERMRERTRKYRSDQRMRNLPQNSPQWYRDLDNGVWEASKIMGIGALVIVTLLILFIISINMG